jgi:hypothetical protein
VAVWLCKNKPSVAITGLTTCERARNSSSEAVLEWVVMYFAKNDRVLHIMDKGDLIQLHLFIFNFLKNAVCSLFRGKKHSRKCAI